MSSYWKKFGFAIKGIKWSFKSQVNFRIQLVVAIIVLATGYIFSISRLEWLIVVLCIAIVLTAELLNSALEGLVDLKSPEWNEKAGRIKDVAAGAVLIIAVGAAIAGIVIFLPKILHLISG